MLEKIECAGRTNSTALASSESRPITTTASGRCRRLISSISARSPIPGRSRGARTHPDAVAAISIEELRGTVVILDRYRFRPPARPRCDRAHPRCVHDKHGFRFPSAMSPRRRPRRRRSGDAMTARIRAPTSRHRSRCSAPRRGQYEETHMTTYEEPCGAAAASRLTLLHDEPDQFRDRMDLQLFHDVAAMQFHGSVADVELPGDRLAGQPLHHLSSTSRSRSVNLARRSANPSPLLLACRASASRRSASLMLSSNCCSRYGF